MLNRKHSDQLFKKALDIIPGGVNSPVRACRSVGAEPVFIDRADGCTLEHGASYEGSVFSNLVLREPLPAGGDKKSEDAGRRARRGEAPPKPRWQDRENRRFTSFIVSPDKLLAAGHRDEAPEQAFLAAITKAISFESTGWNLPS